MIFKDEKERRNYYRLVFRDDLARRVLADIVDRLGFWSMRDTNISAEAQVEMNYIAKQILSDAGAWQDIYNSTISVKKSMKQKKVGLLKRIFRKESQ